MTGAMPCAPRSRPRSARATACGSAATSTASRTSRSCAGRSTEIAGIGAVETALEVQPWPFCEILEVIDPYRNPDRQRGLLITTPDRDTMLSEGDALTLDIFLPPDADYLYLGYVQTDGRVGYITMMPVRQWVQDTGAIRFETGYEISAPFGREMIVAITSGRPLFDRAAAGLPAARRICRDAPRAPRRAAGERPRRRARCQPPGDQQHARPSLHPDHGRRGARRGRRRCEPACRRAAGGL